MLLLSHEGCLVRTGKKAVFLCLCVAPGEQTQHILGASVSRWSPREP